jgi:PAS domain S-box-containing protein
MQFVRPQLLASSFTVRLGLFLAVVLGYTITFVALYPIVGTVTVLLAFLPVGLMAWLRKEELAKQKYIEEALRESEERYRSVVQTVENAIFCLSRDHRILEWNNEAEKLYGWTRDEVLGKDYFELFLPRSIWDMIAADIRKVLAGEPTRNFENVVLTRNGGEHAMLWNVTRLLDAQGQPSGVVACGFDITERKRMEKGLRDSEERYRALYHDNPIMLFTLDAESNIISVNDFGASHLGYTTAELEGQSVLKVFLEPDHAAVVKQLNTCLQNPRQVHQWQLRKIRKDGSQLWVEEFARTVHDPNGRLNILIVCQDITESKQAEAQRLELARTRERAEMLRVFLTSVSHDLITPLTVIITNVYLLEKTTNSEQQHRVETIKAQTLRLEKLIQGILTISRLEGVQELTVGMVNVDRIVRDLQIRYRDVVEKKKLNLQLDLNADLVKALASDQELSNALVRLIENALQFTAEGGTISLRTYQRDDQVVIEVQDTGVGINETDLVRVFDPFYRVDKARSSNTGGIGLGLGIVKRIVELHRGSIDAESIFGQGSLFRIRLPTLPEGSNNGASSL